jgi:hypothetical protein
VVKAFQPRVQELEPMLTEAYMSFRLRPFLSLIRFSKWEGGEARCWCVAFSSSVPIDIARRSLLAITIWLAKFKERLE